MGLARVGFVGSPRRTLAAAAFRFSFPQSLRRCMVPSPKSCCCQLSTVETEHRADIAWNSRSRMLVTFVSSCALFENLEIRVTDGKKHNSGGGCRINRLQENRERGALRICFCRLQQS